MDKNTYTLEVDDVTFAKMKDFYQDDAVNNNSENLEFFARNNNCSISGYKSHKVVFQGAKAAYEASIWDNSLLIDPNKNDDDYTFFGSHAGSDEVGTGDFFGPVIVVAAYVEEKYYNKLVELGVKDSKKLSDDRIREIGKELIKLIPYSQLHLDNVKFNEMTQKGFNMNKLKAYLHNKALLNLQKKLNHKIEYIVMDQFAPEKLYYSYLENEILIQKNITFITKGESHSIAVAAASIIARYSFLLKMDKLSDFAGVTLPKGASEEVDEFAKKLYAKMKKEDFDKICKKCFKNYERLQ